MRLLILFALSPIACATSQSPPATSTPPPTSTASSGSPSAGESTPAAPAEAHARVTPGSPYKGALAAKNDQYYRGQVSAWLDHNDGKRRPQETIEGAKCIGNMNHAAWCQDDRTMIICEQNVFVEVDCGQVVPSGVCALNPSGGGSLDCVTP